MVRPLRRIVRRPVRIVKVRETAFLRHVYAVCRPEVERIPEIESCGSTSAGELNAFAAGRGLAVSFGPFGPDEAGAVSVLDLLATWTAPGQPTIVIAPDQRQFPAVRLPSSQVEFRRAAFHPAPIAILGTVSGDTVYLTPLESSDSDLVALARRLTDDSAPGRPLRRGSLPDGRPHGESNLGSPWA